MKRHSKELEWIGDHIEKALNHQHGVFRWNNEVLTLSNTTTGKIVMSASFRVVGWVKKTDKSMKTTSGLTLDVPFWFHMAASNEVEDAGQKLPAIPAASLRQYMLDFNPAFDEIIALGKGPSVPLFDISSNLRKALASKGFEGFLDMPRESGGEWFVAVKDVKWS